MVRRLGDGDLLLSEIIHILAAGYDGSVVIEQDIRLRADSAEVMDCMQRSINFLRTNWS